MSGWALAFYTAIFTYEMIERRFTKLKKISPLGLWFIPEIMMLCEKPSQTRRMDLIIGVYWLINPHWLRLRPAGAAYPALEGRQRGFCIRD